MSTAPKGKDLFNEYEFFKYVSKGQTYSSKKGATSTYALGGQQQYAATTHSISDVLQGSLSSFSPQDELLVINKTLTDSLLGLSSTAEDIHGFSSFSTTIPGSSVGDLPGVLNMGSGGGEGPFTGILSAIGGWPSSIPQDGSDAAALAALLRSPKEESEVLTLNASGPLP